jgi:hypothetical protein
MRTTRLAPALLLVLAACGDGGADPVGAGDLPTFDPDRVVDDIDNPWLPLVEGARWTYEGEVDGELERVEVVVTGDRRDIDGISAVVVRDTVTVDGELVEDTFDWFAQDEDGNVWYLGEAVEDYEDGVVVSTEGSWEYGVDGAEAGLVMPAEPAVGMRYSQELLPGEAEDMGEVVELDGDRLVVREWNPLEPGTVEHKVYERGTGLVEEFVVEGGEGGVELVDYS